MEVVLSRTLMRMVQIIGAWKPGYGNIFVRIFIWIFMLCSIACQFYYISDRAHFGMGAIMEDVGVVVTNMLSFVKMFILWYNRGYIEECLEIMTENWKIVSNDEDFALMSHYATIGKQSSHWMMGSYFSTLLIFAIRSVFDNNLKDSNSTEKRLFIRMKYPFDVYYSPIYEFMTGVGLIQGFLLVFGNFIADGLLISMITHVSGQMVILQNKFLGLSDVKEFPEIIQKHQSVIYLAEKIELIFSWIGLAEFLSGSIIICSVEFVFVTTLESDLDASTAVKFGSYIVAMTLGVFAYSSAGNILIEKSLNIRDAVYGSRWINLHPKTNKVLITIMMRADRPLCITAGNFFVINYESFINVMKTAASYLSVIRATSQ